MPTDRFARDKATIRAALERRARARQTMTYGEAGYGYFSAWRDSGLFAGINPTCPYRTDT